MVRRSSSPGISQLWSNATAKRSLSSKILTSQAVTELRRGWERFLINWILMRKWTRGSGRWMKAKVHMRNKFDSGSSVKVRRLAGTELQVKASRVS